MDENVHKQEFFIRHLSTRNVTLYPTKAQVVRDINDITLRPGANEITIYGITPTADESSIKVDGRGAAVITDVVVELVRNKEVYEDVYPDSDNEEEHLDIDDLTVSDPENEETRLIAKELMELDDEIKDSTEENRSAAEQLSILNKYGNSVDKITSSQVPDFLEIYCQERKKAFASFSRSESQMKLKNKQRSKVLERQTKAFDSLGKERAKANQQKIKEAEKKSRALKEKIEAKRRLKEERGLFWAKKVYRLTVSLDANLDTPMSSRRGSVESFSSLKQEPVSADACKISLSVSYATNSASWSPRYDLSLNTTSGTGTVIYRAEFLNSSSETWKEAKVSLSTSEAAFQGLGQPTPTMWPWHVRLGNGSINRGLDPAMLSRQEADVKSFHQADLLSKANEPRGALFGLAHMDGRAHAQHSQIQQAQRQAQAQVQHGSLFGAQMQAPPAPPQASYALFGGRGAQPPPPGASNRLPASSLFGAPNSNNEIGSRTAAPSVHDQSLNSASQQGDLIEYSDAETELEHDMPPTISSLATEEATWAEEGLTSSYDIGGLRSISPSFTKRRYRIASVQLKNVSLSYALVPKLRAAAFLKAKIQNSSSITLLRGLAGVTVDGSFLGNTMLSRCTAGQSLSLSLGIDPSVNVTYSKPTLCRNKESGLFFVQKEDSYVFTRTCTIMNTKNRTIEGFMLDQVPLSQDERLKVWILQPTDINGEGFSAETGEGITKEGRKEPKWGKAVAVNKSRGEVRWDFKIESLKGVKFLLEYEAKYPGGDTVIEA